MVEQYGLQDRALFLGQRGDVPVLMQAVDAVIHPSVDPEPFGLTLVEGMLAGTPIIATDCGASSEILDNGRAGTLVAPEIRWHLLRLSMRSLRTRHRFEQRPSWHTSAFSPSMALRI